MFLTPQEQTFRYNMVKGRVAEIDKMVYELYGLSEEEMGIVDNS
jgi:hypothetical protein